MQCEVTETWIEGGGHLKHADEEELFLPAVFLICLFWLYLEVMGGWLNSLHAVPCSAPLRTNVLCGKGRLPSLCGMEITGLQAGGWHWINGSCIAKWSHIRLAWTAWQKTVVPVHH